MDKQSFAEITVIKYERLGIDLIVGDKNQFSFTIDTPSVDETSFMAKYLNEDEE